LVFRTLRITGIAIVGVLHQMHLLPQDLPVKNTCNGFCAGTPIRANGNLKARKALTMKNRKK
jgi:hypothetical protein